MGDGNGDGNGARRRGMRGQRDWLVIVLGMVAALLGGLSLVVLVVIYPKFISLFEELGVKEFPLPTLLCMKASHLVTSKWWIGALCLVVGWALAGRTAVGRACWGRFTQRRRTLVWVVATAACAALVAMPLIVLSMFLPMIAIQVQLATP